MSSLPFQLLVIPQQWMCRWIEKWADITVNLSRVLLHSCIYVPLYLLSIHTFSGEDLVQDMGGSENGKYWTHVWDSSANGVRSNANLHDSFTGEFRRSRNAKAIMQNCHWSCQGQGHTGCPITSPWRTVSEGAQAVLHTQGLKVPMTLEGMWEGQVPLDSHWDLFPYEAISSDKCVIGWKFGWKIVQIQLTGHNREDKVKVI